MRLFYLTLLFSFCFSLGLEAQKAFEFTPRHDYDDIFAEAYDKYPEIPKGILEAVAYTQTRIRHIEHEHRGHDHTHQSCLGLPEYFGVMGLIEDGQGWFDNTLSIAARNSSFTASQMKQDPRANILGFAEAYQHFLTDKKLDPQSIMDNIIVLDLLSELPNDGTTGNDFAFDAHIYSVLTLMNQADFQSAYGLPTYNFDLRKVFGDENYRVVSATGITMDEGGTIATEHGTTYGGNVLRAANPCSDIPGSFPHTVLWDEADPSNYSSRGGTAITHVTIHTMQGTYAGAISWFNNPVANVSAHYNMRASDGQITQMVCEIDKAWHVSNSNPYAVGIEHEGYVEDPIWYTNVTYTTSADLTTQIASNWGIPLIETWDTNNINGLNPVSDGCYSVKGHTHFPNQSHYDPGQYWDWNRYYDLLNPASSTPKDIFTACSGSFQDPGGSGNYTNNERYFYLIEPAGASEVTLSFSAFNLESGYDYLYIYDGDSHLDNLIATLDGTSIPAPITGTSGALLLEFRSDCGTTTSGWDASWTCNTAPSACEVPGSLSQSNVTFNKVNFSWAAVPGASSYEFNIRRGAISQTWSAYTTVSPSISIEDLSSNAKYEWRVKTICGGSSSAYQGTEFVNTGNIPSSSSDNSCTGTFIDAGGHDGGYQNNHDYTFTIAPPGAGMITLDFSFFDMEPNSSGGTIYDFLEIFDGTSTSSPLIGKYHEGNVPNIVTSTGGAMTIRVYSDTRTTGDGWVATWSCDAVAAPPTTTIEPMSPWVTADEVVNFTDESDASISGRYYQVCDFDGTEWRSNANNGFFNDDFDTAIHSDWTSYAGSWAISGGELVNSDEASSNTILSAPMAQDGTHEYMYHWNSSIGGSGTNRRAGLHFFCSDPSLSNRGESYFIYYRVDSDKMQIYRVTGNTFSLEADIVWTFNPNITYDIKTFYNPASGTIRVFVDDDFVGSWTDPSPLTSGSYVSFRSGNCTYNVDDFKVYQSRGASETVSVGPTGDVRYQSPNPATHVGRVRSIIMDVNNTFSVIDELDFKVDWTPPADVTSVTGTAVDAANMSGSWNTSSDTHSDISHYEYSIGSSPESTDALDWTDNGNATSMTQGGLALTPGATYYINVIAYNNAGLPSGTVSSTAIVVPGSMTCDVPVNISVDVTSSTTATLTWNPVAGATKYQVRYRIQGTTAWTTVGGFSNSKNITGLTPATYYEYRVRAECNGTIWSSYSPLTRFYTSICTYPDNQNAILLLNPTNVEFNWSAVADANKYQVRYRPTGGSWTIVGTTGTQTFKRQYGLLANTMYEYRVRSQCSDGNYSNFGPIFTIMTGTPASRLAGNESTEPLSIHPNPAQAGINVRFYLESRGIARYTITNLTGQVVRQGELDGGKGDNQTSIGIRDLDRGYYIFSLVSPEGKKQITKFMKL